MPMVSNLVHSHADKLSDLGIIHVVHAYGVCIEGKGTCIMFNFTFKPFQSKG